MFNFPKGKKKQRDNAIKLDEALEIQQQEDGKTDKYETKLSIPSSWDLSVEERYVYAFHNGLSPKLNRNQISIYGMELLTQENGRVLITGLIRTTVTKNIQFGKAFIVLLGNHDELLAKKEFDLTELGILEPNTARPYKFIFEPSDMRVNLEEPIDSWKLAFELKPKHKLDLEKSWEASIATETRKSLEKVVERAPALKPGEVNFMGVEAKQKKNGNLHITILIRNGMDKDITFEQIPLGFKDASNDEIARGVFKVDNLTVKENTSKPWTFIFPASVVKKEKLDLSKWRVYVIQ